MTNQSLLALADEMSESVVYDTAEVRAAKVTRWAAWARTIVDESRTASADEVAKDADAGFYLASFKRPSMGGHIVWWMPNNAGYASDIEMAGIYHDIKAGYHDSEYTVPVPVSFLRDKRVRRVIDPGDSANAAFANATTLRAAIDAARGSNHD